MIEVGHYGVHWLPGDIAVLVQGSTTTTAIGLDVEAQIPGRRRNRCNHNIDITETADLPSIIDDPLVRAMSPVPRSGRVPWFDSLDKSLLLALSAMSNPLTPIIRPLWTFSKQQLQTELTLTNVQPLVLTDIQPRERRMLDPLLEQSPVVVRPLVLTGLHHVALRPEAERLQTQLTSEHASLPWRQIGARLLREHMLGKT